MDRDVAQMVREDGAWMAKMVCSEDDDMNGLGSLSRWLERLIAVDNDLETSAKGKAKLLHILKGAFHFKSEVSRRI